MTSTTLADSAAVLAKLKMSTMGNRWAHVQAVAARAEELADVVGQDQDVLVAAAWLHDIGYAPDVADTGFHPLDGARYLAGHGWDDRVIQLVAHHSGAKFEAAERGYAAELAEFRFPDELLLDTLVTADMTTGPVGERFDFETRIDDILTRYAPDSPVYRAISNARPYLAAAVERTNQRLYA